MRSWVAHTGTGTRPGAVLLEQLLKPQSCVRFLRRRIGDGCIKTRGEDMGNPGRSCERRLWSGAGLDLPHGFTKLMVTSLPSSCGTGVRRWRMETVSRCPPLVTAVLLPCCTSGCRGLRTWLIHHQILPQRRDLHVDAVVILLNWCMI